MAKLKDLKVTIGLSKKGLTKLNADLRRTKSNFRRNFGEIASMAKNAAFAIGGALVGAVASVIKAGADMEKLEVGFRSIAGGADEAGKMVARLNQFAVSTPFQLQDISRAARQLLAVGTTEDQLTSRLRMLGDIAAASGTTIDEIAAIFAKVQAKGKVELENLNQLMERGIDIGGALRDVTGDMNLEMKAGAVSVEEFNAALQSMTEEGGFAEDAMLNLSETITGKVTTAIDTLKVGLADVGEETGLLDTVSAALTVFTLNLKRAFGLTGDMTKAVAEDVSQLLRRTQQVTTVSFDDTKQALENYRKELLVMRLGTRQNSDDHAFLTEKIDLLDAALQTLNFSLQERINAGEDVVQVIEEEEQATGKKIKVDRKHLKVLADVSAMQRNVASDILAAVHANHTLKGSYDQVGASIEATKAKTSELDVVFAEAARTMAVSAGMIAGAMAAGTSSARDMGNMVLDTLAGLAIQVGELAIATGIAIEGIRNALKTLNPAAALAAGIALVALGSFVRSSLSKKAEERDVPQMAEGGLFTGASLAYVGEGTGTSMINPEVVAPLDKLRNMIGGGNVNVTGTIRGRDLLLSEERSAYSRRRRFGN